MTLSKICSKESLINDNTIIHIRNKKFKILAEGHFNDKSILPYIGSEIEFFTWQDDNHIYIDLKENGAEI